MSGRAAQGAALAATSLVILCGAGCSDGADVPAGPAGTATADGVGVVVTWDPALTKGDARALTVTVTPSAPGARVAADTSVVAGRALTASAPATTASTPSAATVAGKPVRLYPAGAVTFRLPVTLGVGVDPLARTSAGTVRVSVTTCTADACTRPLVDRVVDLGPPPG